MLFIILKATDLPLWFFSFYIKSLWEQKDYFSLCIYLYLFANFQELNNILFIKCYSMKKKNPGTPVSDSEITDSLKAMKYPAKEDIYNKGQKEENADPDGGSVISGSNEKGG